MNCNATQFIVKLAVHYVHCFSAMALGKARLHHLLVPEAVGLVVYLQRKTISTGIFSQKGFLCEY